MWDWFDVQYRTNNGTESWNGKIKKKVQVAHPVLFQFIEILKVEIEATMTSLVHKQNGEKVGRKNSKYAQVDKKIRTVMSNYHVTPQMEYLQGTVL